MDLSPRTTESSPASATLELGSNVASPATARRFVAHVLDGWQTGVDVEIAVLLTSELVTNAVRQAAEPVVVRVHLDDELVRVEVSDLGAGVPTMGTLGDARAASGRGLAIVNAIAAAWGVEPIAGGGKAVWFDVPALPQTT